MNVTLPPDASQYTPKQQLALNVNAALLVAGTDLAGKPNKLRQIDVSVVIADASWLVVSSPPNQNICTTARIRKGLGLKTEKVRPTIREGQDADSIER